MSRRIGLVIIFISISVLQLYSNNVRANTFLACDNNQGESFSSDGCNKCTCINGETFCETLEDCNKNKVVLLDKRFANDCPRGKYYHNGQNWCGCKNGITSCVKRGRK